MFLSLIWKIFEFCSFLASLLASAPLPLPFLCPAAHSDSYRGHLVGKSISQDSKYYLSGENSCRAHEGQTASSHPSAPPCSGPPALLPLRLESKQQPSTGLNSNQPHNLWFSDSDVSVPCPVSVPVPPCPSLFLSLCSFPPETFQYLPKLRTDRTNRNSDRT